MSNIIRTRNRDGLREDLAYGRYYHWKGEGPFLSVTNALKWGVVSPYLNQWHAKVVAEFVDQDWHITRQLSGLEDGDFARVLKSLPTAARDGAGEFGSVVHEVCEDIMLGTVGAVIDVDKKIGERIKNFLAFRDALAPGVVAVEGVVYNREYGYAGAFDAIMDFDTPEVKGRYIVDIKSGRGVYGSAALQQTAYRHGEFIAVGDDEVPMLAVDGAMILHLTPRMWKLIPVETGESSWVAFRDALAMAKWMTGEGEGSERAAVASPVAKGRG